MTTFERLLAFAALTGIYARLVRDGDDHAAHRAALLRSRLPVAHEGRATTSAG